MMTIETYRHAGTWCFTDEKRGLTHEPFVLGIPEIIDLMIKNLPTKDETNTYRIIFSAAMFPKCKTHLEKDKNEYGGAWYTLKTSNNDEFKGWLCPATLKFFTDFPEEIFFHIEPVSI